MNRDTVCFMTLKARDGRKILVLLVRRGDPVLGLDRALRRCRIPLRDITSASCTAIDAGAVTFRATEAVIGILNAHLRNIPPLVPVHENARTRARV